MNFDQLKVLWDEQRAEKLYAFDEATFNQQISDKCSETQRRVNVRDFTTIAIYALTASALLIQPLLSGHGYHKLFGSFVFLCLALYVALRRFKQKKFENRFDQSLAGLLAKAVHRQRSNVRFSQTMIFWAGVPYLAFATVNYFSVQQVFNLPWFLTTLLPIPLMYLVVKIGLQKSDLPKLRELESLQAKFSE